jgi:hypothetical protein
LEGAPFFAVCGRRFEKPRRLLVKVGLHFSKNSDAAFFVMIFSLKLYMACDPARL